MVFTYRHTGAEGSCLVTVNNVGAAWAARDIIWAEFGPGTLELVAGEEES
jgi:hypothetical protein